MKRSETKHFAAFTRIFHAFLSVFDSEQNTVILTCIDAEKKRPKITLNGNFDTLTLFIEEQRESLISEITALCQVNAIALNDKELEILGMKEDPIVPPEVQEEPDTVMNEDVYNPSGYYDSGDDYTEA